MCGIAGICLAGKAKVSAGLLAPLAKALAHRGPDGEAVWAEGGLGLVHTRLAIVDVAGGAQPLVAKFPDGEVALAANGEIYNYPELQTELRAAGVRLSTRSDCEPPLWLYGREGVSAFDKLQGMYGLVLADTRDGTMVVARDCFGIKPLYYAETAKGFACASEPRALLAAGWVAREMNREALGVVLGFHDSPGDATLFAGVKRLMPGEWLVVKEGKIVRRGRRLAPLAAPVARGDEAALEQFDALMKAAMRRHLQGEVGVGAFLSGGLDSTNMVLALRDLGVEVRSFTARFSVDGAKDESAVARTLARQVGALHTEVVYGEEDFWPGVVDMAWALDDMALDYAALPLLKLSHAAREAGVKVVLSGEGGDEIFGGYKSYQRPWWKELLRGWRGGELQAVRGYLKDKKLADAKRHVALPWPLKGWSVLQKKQGADVAGWLPDGLLLKLDRTLMVQGVEGRVPYLDDQLAAFGFALPDALKVREGWGKWLLRERLKRRGFGELAFGKKQGFSVPVGAWLHSGQHRVANLWRQSKFIDGVLTPKGREAMLGKLRDRKVAKVAFSLTVMACWHAMHMEGATRDDVLRLMNAPRG
ncbi:MAG TPA: asparagine synthase (glutamine-hydrolyzing) [Alphaproteobacteria bacterium]|nr:asparagine synthase (glutamine-hydrolyzing) [Alphaproteobacteria bacterium]